MKGLLIAVLVSLIVLANVASLAIVLSGSNTGNAANLPCVAGDVNGDGVVDVSDPVALLGYVFDGQPLPVACACPIADEPLWPPRPADIVNATGLVNLGPGAIAFVFQVPLDRSLVITDFRAVRPSTTGVALSQFLLGVTEVKYGYIPHPNETQPYLSPFQSSVGIVFEPGSDVVIQNLQGGSGDVGYHLVGYLTAR